MIPAHTNLARQICVRSDLCGYIRNALIRANRHQRVGPNATSLWQRCWRLSLLLLLDYLLLLWLLFSQLLLEIVVVHTDETVVDRYAIQMAMQTVERMLGGRYAGIKWYI